MRFTDSFGTNTGHEFKVECAGIRTSKIGSRGPIHRGLDLTTLVKIWYHSPTDLQYSRSTTIVREAIARPRHGSDLVPSS